MNKEQRIQIEKEKMLAFVERQFKNHPIPPEIVDEMEDVIRFAVPDPEVGEVALTKAEIKQAYDKARNS